MPLRCPSTSLEVGRESAIRGRSRSSPAGGFHLEFSGLGLTSHCSRWRRDGVERLRSTFREPGRTTSKTRSETSASVRDGRGGQAVPVCTRTPIAKQDPHEHLSSGSTGVLSESRPHDHHRLLLHRLGYGEEGTASYTSRKRTAKSEHSVPTWIGVGNGATLVGATGEVLLSGRGCSEASRCRRRGNPADRSLRSGR